MTTTRTRPTVAELRATYDETLEEAARLRQQVLDDPLKAIHLAGERQLLDAGARYLQEAIAEVQREEDAATRDARITALREVAARLVDETSQQVDDLESYTNAILALEPELRAKYREFEKVRLQLLDLDEHPDKRPARLVDRYRTASGMSDYILRVKNAISRVGA